jgi:antitoxin MazE
MEKQLRTRQVKLIPIGNSKGIKLPPTLLQKYGFLDLLLLEETADGILLRCQKAEKVLSWEETYQAMAAEPENWEEFESTLLDGLEEHEHLGT